MGDILYTIGHSTHPAEKVLVLLNEYGVTAVADVRSRPYSRMSPHFNRESFASRLKENCIAYVFLGRELGARSDDRGCYLNGQVQYHLLAQTSLFQAGLERVIQGMIRHRVALMCAEKDPLTCHRAILVCRHLIARGVKVDHILENGRLESHENALARLVAELQLPTRDLFRDRKEIIEEAYYRRAQQIAYRESGSSEGRAMQGVGR
jgi:uncharacterized protein (DUF488 family)